MLQGLPDLKPPVSGRRWVKGPWRSQEWEEWENAEPGWLCQCEYSKQLVLHQLLTLTPSPLLVKYCRFNTQAKIASSLAVEVRWHPSHVLLLSGFSHLFFGSTDVVLWHCPFPEQVIVAVPSSSSRTDAGQLESAHPSQKQEVQESFCSSSQQFPFRSVSKWATSFFFFFFTRRFLIESGAVVCPFFLFLSLNQK